MSRDFSLMTTASSDEASSADSGFYSSRNDRAPPPQCSRCSRTLKTRNVNVTQAKVRRLPVKQPKMRCSCARCDGKRVVSKSTCYRHMRIEAEMAEDDAKWEARWRYAAETDARKLRIIRPVPKFPSWSWKWLKTIRLTAWKFSSINNIHIPQTFSVNTQAFGLEHWSTSILPVNIHLIV